MKKSNLVVEPEQIKKAIENKLITYKEAIALANTYGNYLYSKKLDRDDQSSALIGMLLNDPDIDKQVIILMSNVSIQNEADKKVMKGIQTNAASRIDLLFNDINNDYVRNLNIVKEAKNLSECIFKLYIHTIVISSNSYLKYKVDHTPFTNRVNQIMQAFCIIMSRNPDLLSKISKCIRSIRCLPPDMARFTVDPPCSFEAWCVEFDKIRANNNRSLKIILGIALIITLTLLSLVQLALIPSTSLFGLILIMGRIGFACRQYIMDNRVQKIGAMISDRWDKYWETLDEPLYPTEHESPKARRL
jgi:hypothetical protein